MILSECQTRTQGVQPSGKKFDTQFKKAESNFKIAIVVDMWLTGFDVPFLEKEPYFSGSPVEQLHCLNLAAEFVQLTDKIEKRFMFLVKRLKAPTTSAAAAMPSPTLSATTSTSTSRCGRSSPS